jgi:hypothetical protein
MNMNKGMLLVAIGRGRLPGILDTTAKQSFVVFGTIDDEVLTGFTDNNMDLPVYFYETG